MLNEKREKYRKEKKKEGSQIKKEKKYILNAIIFLYNLSSSLEVGSLIHLSTAKLPFLDQLMPLIACDWWSNPTTYL